MIPPAGDPAIEPVCIRDSPNVPVAPLSLYMGNYASALGRRHCKHPLLNGLNWARQGADYTAELPRRNTNYLASYKYITKMLDGVRRTMHYSSPGSTALKESEAERGSESQV